MEPEIQNNESGTYDHYMIGETEMQNTHLLLELVRKNYNPNEPNKMP